MAYTTIDDPSAYFQTKIYTGNGGALAVTNDGNSNLQPDLAWFKKRGGSEGHALFDTSRGIDRFLSASSTAVEQHQPTTGNTDADDIASFDSDGFTFQGGGGAINQSSNTYVAWQWKANGGTTTTNDASATSVGTIDSVYQANTTAGFSIITYTGTNAAGTIAHGLGAVPNVVITKNRNNAYGWPVYHHKNTSAPETDFLLLNTTDATVDNANRWNDTAPTSTVFSVKQSAETNNSDNSDTFVAYCFSEIQGYSKFGSYKGNGDADGTFVYTGFKPAWIMTKRTDANNEAWNIQDFKRSPFNVQDNFIQTDSDAEGSAGGTGIWDALSNGFKLRQNLSSTNNSGSNYIYMAFAESPFVSSEGVPTTAR